MADLTSSTTQDARPELPLPISYAGGRYLVFDITAISYLRREHNICGVFIGTIPHISTQNVFLGIPMELMPEEARLLVKKGIAYVVDDRKMHREGIWGLSEGEKRAFAKTLEGRGREMADIGRREQGRKKEAFFARERAKKEKKDGKAKAAISEDTKQHESSSTDLDADESLFAPSPPAAPPTPEHSTDTDALSADIQQWHITPAASYPPLTPPSPSPSSATTHIPSLTPSYPLYSHLHTRKYFLTPGLRFGCHFCVYPGDPLRFHSHFLAVGKGWDEEFDLLDLVGGGRLGTAVKKGFLLGGEVMKESAEGDGKGSGNGKDDGKGEGEGEGEVRTFCIEWAGM